MNYKSNIRLHVEARLSHGQFITLDKDQSHYLSNVMRCKLGSEIALFNGQDGEWVGEITDIQKRAVTLQIKDQISLQKAEPDIWLVFAPIKKTRIDFIAQKATELGASRLMPMFTRRTIAERVNVDRLRANAIEAAEQCERLTIPQVDDPQKFDIILDAWPSDRHVMFCDESLEGKPALSVLSDARAGMQKPEPWAIFIGPEGGFDDAERSRLNTMQNAHSVTLGPRILRADTAAMAALSIWQTVFGDWRQS